MSTAAARTAPVVVPDFGLGAIVARRGAGEPGWLSALRHAALQRFQAVGLPSVRDEDWRQTPVGALVRATFQAAGTTTGAVDPTALEAITFGHAFDGHQITMVDGRHAPALSSLEREDGLVIRSLRALLAESPDTVEGRLGRILDPQSNAFAALNTAALEDGAVIHVRAGTVVRDPIHVVHWTAPRGAGAPGTAAHPRVLVIAERGSQVTVVESYGSPDGSASFTNAVTEIVVEDGATVDHYKVQREGLDAFHVATMAVRQGRDSRFSSHSVALGGALVRNDVDHAFAGPGGECTLLGMFLAGGTQHTDTHTRIDHAVPHCSSRQVYKGIVDGKARGVFVGRVLVRKDAQKTDAQQTNKNLLLSRQALVHSVPQLEIMADDVKCKHGSTTGQLDPLALFYLRSRGIGEEAARSLLVYAFASDLVSRISVEPLRQGLEQHLRGRLPQAGEIEEAVV